MENLYQALSIIYSDYLNELDPNRLERQIDSVLGRYDLIRFNDWVFYLMIESKFPNEKEFKNKLYARILSGK